jgi:hypothetical protein
MERSFVHQALGEPAVADLKRKSVVGGGGAIPAIATATGWLGKTQISHEVD